MFGMVIVMGIVGPCLRGATRAGSKLFIDGHAPVGAHVNSHVRMVVNKRYKAGLSGPNRRPPPLTCLSMVHLECRL